MHTVTLLGVPWDDQSSFLRGAAAAPDAIRAALVSPSSNLSTESGLEFGTDAILADGGNIQIPTGEATAVIDVIARAAGDLIGRGTRVLAIGGDHAITFPLIRA